MTETVRSEAEVVQKTFNPVAAVGTALHQTWWLALGIVATVVEQAARVADTLVEKGRDVEPTVLRPVRRAAAEVTDAAEGAGERLRLAAARVDLPAVLHRAATPTKEEFDRLVEEVRELRAKVAKKTADAAAKVTGES